MPRSFWVIAVLLLGGWMSPDAMPGWSLYDRLCVACHGANGDGYGPAAPFTIGRPRSFQRGVYMWRSTRLGQPPTDDDLRTTIAFGAPGSSMPGFGEVLAPSEIDQLIAIVKAFAPGAFATEGTAVPIAPPPARDPARGEVLFEKLCRACHGTGAGDGPSAFALAIQPYRFDTLPFRRPRTGDDPDGKRLAVARSIATGLAGTPMPSFAGKLPDDEIWALADHIVAINERARADHRTIDADVIALDQKSPIDRGTWPGRGETSPFGGPIDPQGAPPASLAPAQASLDDRQCGRCHSKQVREAESSVHRAAGSPGFLAQTEFGNADRTTCLRCHAPLPEQAASQGITCAACHVRGWTRGGPPNVAASLLPLPGYPLATASFYERSDFCLPCHQLPPRLAIAGKPVLDTYREWLESPYMKRGMQCQHCHMPNREHAMLGIHDPQTFRQGIELTATAHRNAGAVTALAGLRNIGAGHDLPTTAAPKLILRIELVDARGRAIEGARAELAIGRDVGEHGEQGEGETSDTRIPPGEQVTFARAWTAGRTNEAALARVTVEVHPDAFYERFYAGKLAGKLEATQRVLFEQALAKARASHYIAELRDVVIDPGR